MDRPTTRKDAAASDTLDAPGDAFVLPSRKPAIEACRALLESGPILVTGDAGSGKTWLWNRLQADLMPHRRWLGIDVTPSVGPDEFFRLLARGLGLPDLDNPTRSEIADFLADRRADGEGRVLVIEEAHNLSLAVFEEVRVLANRLGRSDGFASILIVGQTPLARRFSTWPYASVEARLAARIHLGPIDADEATALLATTRPVQVWSRSEIEVFHRDSGGNPGRLLRRIGRLGGSPGRHVSALPPVPLVVAKPPSRPSDEPESLIGPSRPPLRSEENLIEVGWSPEEAEEPGSDEESEMGVGGRSSAAPMGDEAVHDHYAALQAWREWAENQGRLAPVVSDRDIADAIDDELAAEASEEVAPSADRPTVWADEGEDSFAPFSQLFSRMTQSRTRSPE